jgi:peroxiredoxin
MKWLFETPYLSFHKMLIMKYIFVYIAAIVLLAAAKNPKEGYTITGTVPGMPDSTWLYLEAMNPHRCVDSCMVVNGKFMMKGRITENAVQAVLTTKDYKNYVSFWLENTPINMTLQAGDFKKGTITGTKTGEDEKRLLSLREAIHKQSDSLRKILKVTPDTIAQKEIRLQIKRLGEQDRQTMHNWIIANPNSVYAAHLLDFKSMSWGKETTSALYNKLSRDMKASQYGQKIKNFIELHQDILVGGKLADFEQANTEGKMIKLSQIKGKYILLDFWASNCGPCIVDNRELVKTYARFKDKGFAVLGVSLDDNKEVWLKKIAQEGYTWENVCDLKGVQNKAVIIYGIEAIPNNFLIDEHGVIIARNLRGKGLSDKLEQLLP